MTAGWQQNRAAPHTCQTPQLATGGSLISQLALGPASPLKFKPFGTGILLYTSLCICLLLLHLRLGSADSLMLVSWCRNYRQTSKAGKHRLSWTIAKMVSLLGAILSSSSLGEEYEKCQKDSYDQSMAMCVQRHHLHLSRWQNQPGKILMIRTVAISWTAATMSTALCRHCSSAR